MMHNPCSDKIKAISCKFRVVLGIGCLVCSGR